jgi:hypothetical protein
MERQRGHSPSFKSITGTALAGLGILVLLGNVDCAVAQLKYAFCATAGDALGMWPCLVLAGCQVVQAYAFDHYALLGWLLQMLLSLPQLLLFVSGAI